MTFKSREAADILAQTREFYDNFAGVYGLTRAANGGIKLRKSASGISTQSPFTGMKISFINNMKNFLYGIAPSNSIIAKISKLDEVIASEALRSTLRSGLKRGWKLNFTPTHTPATITPNAASELTEKLAAFRAAKWDSPTPPTTPPTSPNPTAPRPSEPTPPPSSPAPAAALETPSPTTASAPAQKLTAAQKQAAKQSVKARQAIGAENFTPDHVARLEAGGERVIIDILPEADARALGFSEPRSVTRSIDGDAVRHVLNRHGEGGILTKNGQPAVTREEIANYPQITAAADEQILTQTDLNLPARTSFKQINGYHVVVEEVHNGQGELAFKTMFKGSGDYKNSEVYQKIKSAQAPFSPSQTARRVATIADSEILPASPLKQAETPTPTPATTPAPKQAETPTPAPNSNLKSAETQAEQIRALQAQMEEVSAKYSENGTITVRNYDQHVKPIAEQIRALQSERAAALKDVIADPATSAQARAAAQAEFDELDKILNPPPPAAPKKSRAEIYRENERKKHERRAEANAQEAAREAARIDAGFAPRFTKLFDEAAGKYMGSAHTKPAQDFVDGLSGYGLEHASKQINAQIAARTAKAHGVEINAAAKDMADAHFSRISPSGAIDLARLTPNAKTKQQAAQDAIGRLTKDLSEADKKAIHEDFFCLYQLHFARKMLHAKEAAAKTSTASANPAPTATAPNSNLREAIAKVAHAAEPTPPAPTASQLDLPAYATDFDPKKQPNFADFMAKRAALEADGVKVNFDDLPATKKDNFAIADDHSVNIRKVTFKPKPSPYADGEINVITNKHEDKIGRLEKHYDPLTGAAVPDPIFTHKTKKLNYKEAVFKFLNSGAPIAEAARVMIKHGINERFYSPYQREIADEVKRRFSLNEAAAPNSNLREAIAKVAPAPTPTATAATTAAAPNSNLARLEAERDRLKGQFIDTFKQEAENYYLYTDKPTDPRLKSGAELLKRDLERLRSGAQKRTGIPDAIWLKNKELQILHRDIEKIEQEIQFEKNGFDKQKFSFLNESDMARVNRILSYLPDPQAKVNEAVADIAAQRAQSLKEVAGGLPDRTEAFITHVAPDKDIVRWLAQRKKTTIKNMQETLNREREYINTIFEKVGKKPLAQFGKNYAEFYHDGAGAVRKLIAEAGAAGKGADFNAQVAGAFYREDLGDIDLVWGDDKVGLKKIIQKHLNEFTDFDGNAPADKLATALGEIIKDGKLITKDGVETIYLQRGEKYYLVGLSNGFGGVGENKWIITRYEPKHLKPDLKEKIGNADKTISADTSASELQTFSPIADSEILPASPLKQTKTPTPTPTTTPAPNSNLREAVAKVAHAPDEKQTATLKSALAARKN